jgi:hypothetical protein
MLTFLQWLGSFFWTRKDQETELNGGPAMRPPMPGRDFGGKARRADFELILVYDISRWERFQDVDESAYYEFICKEAGIQVLYCAEQFENDGSLASAIHKTLRRGTTPQAELLARATSTPSSPGTTTRPKRSITASAAGMHLAASLMMDGFACRTMLLSVRCGRSRWGEKIGPSPGPMRAAGVRQRNAESPEPNTKWSKPTLIAHWGCC